MYIRNNPFVRMHLMADAGTLVGGTGNYVDSYNGTETSFAAAGGTFAPGMKIFWDTVMLQNARDNAVFAQLGNKQPLPANQGMVVEWAKCNTLPDADELVEGVIPTGKVFGESIITTTLTEHGLYVATTKKLQLHHNRNVVLGATQEVGASLSRSYEKLIRAALLEGTNVLYADALNTGASNVFVSTPTARHEVSNAAGTYCGMTLDMISQAVTRLEAANAPTFDGMNYVAVIHPYIARDIRRLEGWQEMHKYAAVKELFTNELGEVNGVRFLKSTLAPIVRGANLLAGARTMTVLTYTDAGNKITVAEAITPEDATALQGREVIIDGEHMTIVAAEAGGAGAAYFTVNDTDEEAWGLNEPEATNVVYPGEGGAAGISVFPCLFFGADAFNIIDPEGAGMETIIKSAEQVGGPLNQFSTVGGKFEGAAKIVYPDRLVSVECVSSYSATAASN